MSTTRDPLGKRALFSVATEERPPEPRTKSPFDLDLHCSKCKNTTTLNAPQLLFQFFPFAAWVPGRSHSHLMRCPACQTLTWVSISLAR